MARWHGLAAPVALAALAAGHGATAAQDPAPAPAAPAIRVAALPSPAGPGSQCSRAVAGPDGRLHLSWVEPTADGAHALRSATRDGEGWTEPVTIATGRDWVVNWADFPSLAVGPEGHRAAHWLQQIEGDPHAYGIRVACSTDGGATWRTPFWLHADRQRTEHGFAAIVPLAAGRFRAVWLDGRALAAEGRMELRAVEFEAAGPASEEAVLDPRVCECCATALVESPGAGTLVAYRDRTDAEVRDIALARGGAAGWAPPAPLHADGWVIPG